MSTNQLLRNYSYMLLKELKRTSKDNVGDIEFYKEELKKIEQALADTKPLEINMQSRPDPKEARSSKP